MQNSNDDYRNDFKPVKRQKARNNQRGEMRDLAARVTSYGGDEDDDGIDYDRYL